MVVALACVMMSLFYRPENSSTANGATSYDRNGNDRRLRQLFVPKMSL